METEPGASPSDEEWMLRLQAGDEAALAPLMQRWEIPMKRFLFRLVGNPTEAEDLAQEVFVRVFAKRATYRPGAKFSTWCFAIAANQARNRLRWWRRRPALSLDAWTDAGGDAADESAQASSAAAQAVGRERAAAVQRAVAALPVDLRSALVLFEYEQQSVNEIAAALACTPKAVENRLYRARQQLRDALKGWMD